MRVNHTSIGARGIFTFAVLLGSGLLVGCGGGDNSGAVEPANIGTKATTQNPEPKKNEEDSEQESEPIQLTAHQTSSTPAKPQANQFPEVLIHTTLGDIRVRLNSEKAPVTVDNFLANYVERGFYSRTIFHYVDKASGLMAGGGYTSDFTAKETRAYIRNEANNGLKNLRGTITMARDPEVANSSTSQFFINFNDNPALDHQGDEPEAFGYCVFGEVVDGMDVVDKIAEVKVHNNGNFIQTPVEPVLIQSIQRLK